MAEGDELVVQHDMRDGPTETAMPLPRSTSSLAAPVVCGHDDDRRVGAEGRFRLSGGNQALALLGNTLPTGAIPVPPTRSSSDRR